MTDTQDTPVQSLAVNGQFIKDLSFEVPHAPTIFAELRQAPEIPIGIDIQASRLGEDTYEVVLAINVEAKAGDKTAFILELSYAGVFTLRGLPQDHVQPVLLIECPRLLFPFARNVIADLTRDGGFPPLMMQPIDFVALYRQRMENQAGGQATA